jgi:hypothetical protein
MAEAAARASRALARPAVALLLPAVVIANAPAAVAAAGGPVDFNRDVRPILSDFCFHCHGPDPAQRKAGLRLDTREGALRDLGGSRAVEPGQPDRSELLARLEAGDADDRMPPAETGRRLSPAQIETLRRWIAQGARYEPHWAFTPIARPAPPAPAAPPPGWDASPIDRFVLARLEAEGLEPSPPAARETWLRRVTLDLTGLPPAPAEVDSFAADGAPDAFEKVVDRLLASPRHGERMAMRWLEAARYADTNGYQADGERVMWRWRDWVIDAFNRNMPFDQFTIEQLAGDLLPGATLTQRLATAFNRNHRGNAEGGIVPEEYAVEYVADRVETTGTVWLGLTLTCARCHDHKFDPLSQRDYYGLFALFNSVPEKGKAVRHGNSPPHIKTPTPEQAARLRDLDRAAAAARAAVERLEPALVQAQRRFEAEAAGAADLDFTVGRRLVGWWARFEGDGTAARELGDLAAFTYASRFSVAAWVTPALREGGGPVEGGLVSRIMDDGDHEGWSVRLVGGRVEVAMSKRWLDDAFRVRTRAALPAGRATHVTVTYDGSRFAPGVRVYLDGAETPLDVELDGLNFPTAPKAPLRLGAFGSGQRFRGRLEDVRIFDDTLAADEAAALATRASIGAIARTPPAARTRPEAAKLRAYVLARVAPAEIREAHRRDAEARRARDLYEEGLPTTMVMEELPAPRAAYILVRGEYDRRGDRVEPGVPSALSATSAGRPVRNRLDLARWLTSPAHPLVARVTANRLWQMLFGEGLVKTAEDFGAQGEPPSHPELLDWLASELVASGWDVKALLRAIVLSATYRQDSAVTPASLERDPENRLHARGPRFRLPADMIRDQALAASGLLVEKLGGPSVRPYQPDGVWTDLGAAAYARGKGDDLYRRSLYTFWKRTVPPPGMTVFDATSRETCSVRPMRTNTPLQALALLNDVTYVEAARHLGARMIREGGRAPAERLRHGFRLLLGRSPRPEELAALERQLAGELAHFRRRPADAERLARVGDKPHAAGGAPRATELAAYTQVASLLLNLDEAVTKE